jgi:hypothetical protein
VLGVDHPDTLRSAHNLATRMTDLGEHPVDLGESTLAGMRQVLGEEHPDTRDALRTARRLGHGIQ